MTIEEEISQVKFKNEHQKAGINLIFTGNWLQLRYSVYLKKFNLTLQQYNVLRILKGQDPNPITVNDIISRMLDKMSNASRIIDKLVLKKLTDRKICPKDRRQMDVRITSKGLELLGQIDVEFDSMEKKIIKLTIPEAKELNSLLDKIRG
jgi:DNA-binding MarR family transcriptional regulator